MNEQETQLAELTRRVKALEFQVEKLDRLVYKLFKRRKQEEYPQYH